MPFSKIILISRKTEFKGEREKQGGGNGGRKENRRHQRPNARTSIDSNHPSHPKSLRDSLKYSSCSS